jgi:hypothetical protein
MRSVNLWSLNDNSYPIIMFIELPPVNGTVVPTNNTVCGGRERYSEHPTDCMKFYECAKGMGPPEHPDVIEKTCGPGTFYNPKSKICDWPENVIQIKPRCEGIILFSYNRTVGNR